MHKIKSYSYSIIFSLVLVCCNNEKSPNRFKYCNYKGVVYENFLHQDVAGLFDEICEQINIRKSSCDYKSSETKIVKKIKHKCFGVQNGSLIPRNGRPLLIDQKEKIDTSFEENLEGMCILQSFIDINLKEEVFPIGVVYCLEGTYIVTPNSIQK